MMTQDGWSWSNETSIHSDKGAGQPVVRKILDRLKQFDWDENDIFAIHLSLEEALVNAIRHGNGYDPTKLVQVVCQLSLERCRIKITDEGKGFDPHTVPDPTDDRHLDLPSGRGVHLIRSFMSTVHYNDSGNSVTMEKVRST